MKDCNSQKNRTVKTESDPAGLGRRGRKIPKEIFIANPQACNDNNPLHRSRTPNVTIINPVYGHQHVMNAEQVIACMDEMDYLRGALIRDMQLQYLPSSLYYANHDNELPF